MTPSELMDYKFSNYLKAVNREEGAYIPTATNGNMGSVAWSGKRVVDVYRDPKAFAEAITCVFAEMWTDVNIMCGANRSPFMIDYLEGVENRVGPDGTTMEHYAQPWMKADEYDQLIEDPARFISEVMLPRKFPKLFEDREYAKNALKGFAQEQVHAFIYLSHATNAVLENVYGIKTILNGGELVHLPLDQIFDTYRGFRGTLTDLRRQPDKVKAAIDKLWETRSLPILQKPYTQTFPYAWQPPHIPAYLSPKQFDEYYWIHEKPMIEHYIEAGGKFYFIMEGRFEKIWHHFRELPKDSLILHVDDDDIVKAKKEIGDHQIIVGGLKMADARMKSFAQIKDDVKRVVDECGPGGGFLFSTDKAWIAPGDINQTVIDAYNFVHEYSAK